MTVTKDDGHDYNFIVPNMTDDQSLYGSRYILYHRNVEDRKNHKKQTTDLCVTLWCFIASFQCHAIQNRSK